MSQAFSLSTFLSDGIFHFPRSTAIFPRSLEKLNLSIATVRKVRRTTELQLDFQQEQGKSFVTI